MTALVLSDEIGRLPDRCETSAARVAARAAEILRPAGALQRLDDVAVWLAGWQRSASPTVERPAALIFAGDHGVATDGVSAYPPDVTAAMLEAFRQDRASISALARVAGAEVRAIDVGVGSPTGNIRTEPAMGHGRFQHSFDTGRAAVGALDTDLLIIGEMGIGNTTAAAAVAAALLEADPSHVVGAGTGVEGAALVRKLAVVSEAVARARRDGADVDRPLEVLRQLGGTELAAMAGALFEARQRSIPVLLDGFVTAAPALALHRLDPKLCEHTWAGHGSAEPGHRLVLDALGLVPLLTLDFRLGEASGAMAAVPLVAMACGLINDVPTFGEWFEPTDDGP